jgi:hypothetical protein
MDDRTNESARWTELEIKVPLNSIRTSHFKENQVHSMKIKVADTGTFISLSLTEVFFLLRPYTSSNVMSL